MANDLTFTQISAILADIVSNATGETQIAPVDTSSFVSMAQKALLVGYDPLATAISQVLARTIFSIRPYTERFVGLRVSNQKYGNHVRKLTALDDDPVDSEVYSLTDGVAVDQYEVRKPKVLQTNFYGQATYQDFVTIYTVQIDNALQGPDEFASFISMIIQNMSDRMTQRREELARMTLANMIGAKYAADTGNVIHLLTEYNAFTGGSYTITTIRQAVNWEPFIKWVYARINNISDLLTARSYKFHMNFTGQNIPRHTPYNRQKMYLSSFEGNYIDSAVLSSVFNEDKLKMIDYQPVDFWQSIDSPSIVKVKPSYVNAAGTVVNATDAVETAPIFGVLFDDEALGYTVTDESVERTPYNARGKYWNQYYTDTKKYWNDLTENFVLFVLD